MNNVKENESCCAVSKENSCRVEAVVGIDARGQMILPKELRDKAGIKPGDKLVLSSWLKDGSVCCITITKAEQLVDVIRATVGPVEK